jgi:hypothetical protein
MNTLGSPAPSANLLNVFSPNRANSISNTNTVGGISILTIILGSVTILLLGIIALYWNQIQTGMSVLYEKIRTMFGASEAPIPPQEIAKRGEQVTKPPHAPQEPHEQSNTLVEKILPGRKEVFNISKNIFGYADAEPLCRALGAELATYEQVKQAYTQGADWCNYGWVKGQMAVYPTQESTWKKLQEGPEEQRNACGRPGLNGGHFDNPDLRFGVNCYGQKPDQSNHDANAVASRDGAPLTPEGIEFDKKVAKYRGEANSISILPWNQNQWSG